MEVQHPHTDIHGTGSLWLCFISLFHLYWTRRWTQLALFDVLDAENWRLASPFSYFFISNPFVIYPHSLDVTFILTVTTNLLLTINKLNASTHPPHHRTYRCMHLTVPYTSTAPILVTAPPLNGTRTRCA